MTFLPTEWQQHNEEGSPLPVMSHIHLDFDTRRRVRPSSTCIASISTLGGGSSPFTSTSTLGGGYTSPPPALLRFQPQEKGTPLLHSHCFDFNPRRRVWPCSIHVHLDFDPRRTPLLHPHCFDCNPRRNRNRDMEGAHPPCHLPCYHPPSHETRDRGVCHVTRGRPQGAG